MSGYINVSGNYRFEELGIIHVNVKSTARSVSARWRDGAIVVNAPRGIAYDRLIEILRQFAPRLESTKPESPYRIGQTLEFSNFKVTIRQQNYHPDKMYARFENPVGYIDLGSDWDINAPDTIKHINKYLCRMAQIIAQDILIPRARELAKQVNKFPLAWTISNGHRVLGHCNSNGVIALSYALLFYPDHLRDYVIFHELAHLSELNHSPRFHAICDKYCQGREQQLQTELRLYKPQVIR